MSLFITSLRALAAGAALLLMPGAQAARPQAEFPILEVLLLDIAQPIEKSEIDVAVFIAPESCTPKMHENTWGNMVSSDNDSLIHSWACRAYMDAAVNPEYQVAFIPTPPSFKRPSIRDTVQGLPPSTTGRRYVALVDWTFADIMPPKNCNYGCNSDLIMLSESVVYDRVADKPVWHSIQTKHASMSELSYTEKNAKWLGPGLVSGTLTSGPVIDQYAREADGKGVRRTTALKTPDQPGQAGTVLNPKANLIIFNRLSQETLDSRKFDDGNHFYSLVANHLDGRAKKTYYMSHSRTHVALELVPGTYQLSLEKNPMTIEIKEHGSPVYLSFGKGFMDKLSVSEIDAKQALALAQDSLNALLPELTPVAYPLRGRKLQWTQP